ncbi:MAG: cellulase family glycosylhydrolase, partial [Kiritimatiellae bacterium]|nr:cellulase family glycosylhydrolase [Kiritimatiellia bacterium]
MPGAAAPGSPRHAALYYEDPALNLQFGLPHLVASSPEGFSEEISRLAAVMRFSGFDTLFYPGAWYQGLIGEGDYNPRRHAPHWRDILYDSFDAEGLSFIPTINLNNIPWEPGAVTAESLSDGSLHPTPIAIHATGRPNPGLWHNTPPNFNFFHPGVQAEIERVFDTLVAEGAAHPSFGGVCLHLTRHCCLWWGDEDSGYNDYAVAAFCRERGLTPPAPIARALEAHPDAQASSCAERGRDYAEWLRSDPALREAWIQWRCDQVTAFYARLAAKLNAAHPGAKLHVNYFVPPDVRHPDFGKPGFTRAAARRAGLDVPSLEAAASNLVVMQTSIPADYRWGYVDRYFRFDDPEARDEAVARIRDLDASPDFWSPLGEASRPWANQHDRYWESAIGARGDTLSCDWLDEHKWRVSTLNPGGDNALAHFARPLRFGDALGLSKGGFLVGTYGMEDRLAPFLLAFRSLPPVVLPELPESTELVKIRGGEWNGTNYLYAVNTGDEPAEVALPAPCGKVALAPNQLFVKAQAVENKRLVVEILPGSTNLLEHHVFPLDLTPYFAKGLGVRASVRVSGENITEPDNPWNGPKFMFHYRCDLGRERWPGAALPRGSFTNLLAELRLSPFDLAVPQDGRAELILGLEGCTGRVDFDLSTLRVEAEDWGLAPTNRDWRVRYPDDAGDNRQPTTDNPQPPNLPQGPCGLAGSPQPGGRRGAPLRGCMLPGRATREDDIETLRQWGATLVRFQITRNWWKVDDNQDLAEYARWVDSRLDNLEQVLGWCAARGMKVCIDLHAVPGGKRGLRGRPYEMNMFRDERYLAAYLDTWRRIAARFRGNPAIYGYDLVNEPNQRGPAPFSYWEVQRLAAEAVREIDPDTPIIVESNLADRACAFRYLSPLAMDNVIYQCHMYQPTEYTHQGVAGSPATDDGRPLTWPGAFRGEVWDKDFIRRELAPVVEFQRRHGCRIYVGEFSAAAYAPGAENYLRDCIELFEEYGWDWTYHAFREAPVWDVDMEGADIGGLAPAASETPRRRVLLDALG